MIFRKFSLLSLFLTETEEGFIKLYIKEDTEQDAEGVEVAKETEEEVEEEEEDDPTLPIIKNIRHLLLVRIFRVLLVNVNYFKVKISNFQVSS